MLRAELEAEDAAHELSSARVGLSVLWGETTPDFERVAGSLHVLRDPAPLESLLERVRRSPDDRQFAMEAERLDAQARVADAGRRPDVTATLGVRRLEAIDDRALVLSFWVPIGLAPRAGLAIARTRAERNSLDERRRAFELDRHRELFARYEALRHARHELVALQDRMIPAAERALALARRGYEEARYSFLQVAQTRGVLLGLQRDRITAATRYHRLLADIERATAASGDLHP